MGLVIASLPPLSAARCGRSRCGYLSAVLPLPLDLLCAALACQHSGCSSRKLTVRRWWPAPPCSAAAVTNATDCITL